MPQWQAVFARLGGSCVREPNYNIMLAMENEILDSGRPVPPAVARSVQRSLGPRYSAYLDEVQRLLRAGIQEIAERGSVEPRVTDIVRRAGLSNKAFYRHFQSKDELLLAILEEGLRARLREFEERLAAADSAVDRVRSWVRCVVEQASDPKLAAQTRPLFAYQARLNETIGAEFWRHRDLLKEPLEKALEEGKRNGELPNVDPKRDAEMVFFQATGWMHTTIIEGRSPSREEGDYLVEYAVRGLLAAAKPS